MSQQYQPQQYGPPAPAAQPPHSGQPGHRRGLFRGHPVWTAFVVIILAIAVGVIIRAASDSVAPAAPAGYNDPARLAASIKQQAGAKLAKEAPGTKITQVICVHASGTAFVCDVALSDGTSVSDNVTVAADGNSYVSSP